MTSLRRARSMESFCLELESSAEAVVQRNLFSRAQKTPKEDGQRYMAHTFNSTLRSQPPIPKQQDPFCKSLFCEEMEKLLKEGLWIETRSLKRNAQRSYPEAEQVVNSSQTRGFTAPTFNFQKATGKVKESERDPEVPNNKPKGRRISTEGYNRTCQGKEEQLLPTYESRIRSILQSNKRIKQELDLAEGHTSQIKRIGNNARQEILQKQKSRQRQQKIRDLLGEIGVPLNELESSKSRSQQVGETTTYE